MRLMIAIALLRNCLVKVADTEEYSRKVDTQYATAGPERTDEGPAYPALASWPFEPGGGSAAIGVAHFDDLRAYNGREMPEISFG